VGDAIVITYRAELDGLPAIFLPPLTPDLAFEGVSVYRDMPEVQDGETARRAETVTLVFEAGGEHRIPGLELSFWNTASRSAETVTASGRLVSVKGPPAASTTAADAAGSRWQRVAAIAVSAIALLAVLWRVLPILWRRYREAAERRRLTEDYAFRQLLGALGSGEPAETYQALLRWVDRLEPGMDARSFAAHCGDESLSEALTALSRALYGGAEGSVDLGPVRRKLQIARRRHLDRNSVSSALELPPLNP
jgi:hypothetical protein